MHHAGAGVLFQRPPPPALVFTHLSWKKVPGKKYILLDKMVI